MGILRARVAGQWVDIGTNPLPAGRRNLLDNGAMQVSQRGITTTNVGTSGYYGADRWRVNLSSIGVYKINTFTNSDFGNPMPAGVAPTSIFYAQTTAADPAPAAGDFAVLQQYIEGQNLQHLLWGTAAAKPLTVSGWAWVSIAGTYYVELQYAAGAGRSASFPLTFPAGVWTYFSHTFPGNTVDAFVNDSAAALNLQFWFGAGSNFTSGTWSEGWTIVTANRAPGQSNGVPAANGRTFGITQVQLEVGGVVTPFETVDYATDLARCQRYFQRKRSDQAGSNYSRFSQGLRVTSATGGSCTVPLVGVMRRVPTATFSAPSTFFIAVSSTFLITAISQDVLGSSVWSIECDYTVASGLVAGQAGVLCSNASSAATIDATADL